MNKVILIGRLTKDPEIRYAQGSEPMAIARFTLAVDRGYKKEGQESADFISCVAFKKPAEFIDKYAYKGMKFAIEGRIQTGSYNNKDGQKVYTTDVIVEHIEFAEGKREETEKPQVQTSGNDGFMNIPDEIQEELPFN